MGKFYLKVLHAIFRGRNFNVGVYSYYSKAILPPLKRGAA
jgi:hypothetical protein